MNEIRAVYGSDGMPISQVMDNDCQTDLKNIHLKLEFKKVYIQFPKVEGSYQTDIDSSKWKHVEFAWDKYQKLKKDVKAQNLTSISSGDSNLSVQYEVEKRNAAN